MAENPDIALLKEIEAAGLRFTLADDEVYDPLLIMDRFYHLWREWADFHIYMIEPIVSATQPVMIEPALLEDSGAVEFVYPIQDAGNRLSTSKGVEMYTAGMSMSRLFNTIEKMFAILIERLEAQGATVDTDIRIAFGGHQIAQRKGFEVSLNLEHQVIVVNFDEEDWPKRHIAVLKNLVKKGFKAPTKAPRYSFRYPPGKTPSLE